MEWRDQRVWVQIEDGSPPMVIEAVELLMANGVNGRWAIKLRHIDGKTRFHKPEGVNVGILKYRQSESERARTYKLFGRGPIWQLVDGRGAHQITSPDSVIAGSVLWPVADAIYAPEVPSEPETAGNGPTGGKNEPFSIDEFLSGVHRGDMIELWMGNVSVAGTLSRHTEQRVHFTVIEGCEFGWPKTQITHARIIRDDPLPEPVDAWIATHVHVGCRVSVTILRGTYNGIVHRLASNCIILMLGGKPMAILHRDIPRIATLKTIPDAVDTEWAAPLDKPSEGVISY